MESVILFATKWIVVSLALTFIVSAYFLKDKRLTIVSLYFISVELIAFNLDPYFQGTRYLYFVFYSSINLFNIFFLISMQIYKPIKPWQCHFQLLPMIGIALIYILKLSNMAMSTEFVKYRFFYDYGHFFVWFFTPVFIVSLYSEYLPKVYYFLRGAHGRHVVTNYS